MSLSDLPAEIFEIILKFLPVTERVRCRQVDRKWLFVVDNMNMRCLVLSKPANLGMNRWAFTNELVKLDNLLVRVSFESDLKGILGMRMFSRLKKLYFSSPIASSVAEVCLGQLEQLKELKLCVLSRSPWKLSHPKIETLEIYNYNCVHYEGPSLNDFHVILDTPNLTQLKFRHSDEIVCLHPEKIKSIYQAVESLGSPIKQKIDNFINLESASFIYLDDLEIDALSRLSNLEKINFLMYMRFDEEGKLDRKMLLNLSDRLKRISESKKELKINYRGFYLNTLLKDCRYKALGVFSIEDFEMATYLESLDNLSETLPIKYVFLYEQSFNSLANRMEANGFWRRFICLRQLGLGGAIENEQQLIDLLDDCKLIENISFQDCSLSEHFYQNVLVRKLPYLKSFELKGPRLMNLDFLLKLIYITYIHIDYLDDDEQFRRFFQGLQFLSHFRFRKSYLFFVIFEYNEGFQLKVTRSYKCPPFFPVPRNFSKKFANFETLESYLLKFFMGI